MKYSRDHYEMIVVGSGFAAQALLNSLDTQGYRGSIAVVECGKKLGKSLSFSTFCSPLRIGKRNVRDFGLGGTSSIWGGNVIPFAHYEVPHETWGFGYEEIFQFLRPALHFLGFHDKVDEMVREWQTNRIWQVDSPALQAQFRHSSQEQRTLVFENSIGRQNVNLYEGWLATGISKVSGCWELAAESKDGSLQRITANMLVLANGGLESLRLLSTLPSIKTDCRELGKRWSAHLQGVVGTASLKSAPTASTQDSLGIIRQEFLHISSTGRLGSSAYKVQFFKVRNSLLLLPTLGFRSLKVLFQLALDQLRGMETFLVNVDGDQPPNLASRVEFGSGSKIKIFHKASAEDSASLVRLMQILREHLGADCFRPLASNQKSLLRLFKSTSHHLGGAAIATKSNLGVVDPNLEVHGHPNLFVCSSAVFPTFSSANPTLMLVQLAIRLGRYLGNERVERLSS